jgi:hypothetical protein
LICVGGFRDNWGSREEDTMLKTISIGLCAALLALAGCKKDDGGGGATTGCEGVGNHARKMLEADMKKEMDSDDMKDLPPELKKQMEGMLKEMKEMPKKIGSAAATSCKQDGWSKEAIDCFLATKDFESEGDKCKSKLTDEQQKKFDERIDKVAPKMGFDD